MSEKVGIDVSAADYWERKSAVYAAGIEGPYHRHRLAMVNALTAGLTFADARCVDVGCGEGVFTEHLLAADAKVRAFDIDSGMIGKAESRTAKYGDRVELEIGGIEKLSSMSDASADILIALNVLAYLTSDEEDAFYRHSARILVPGGSLVVTHSNELFDLFTLNRYTVEFFGSHFSVDGTQCNVADLLRWPGEPTRSSFAVRENPLVYRFKLARWQFHEVRQEFAHFHHQPPLLTPERDPDDINSRQYRDTLDWPDEERWKLMFTCSMFGSRAVRVS